MKHITVVPCFNEARRLDLPRFRDLTSHDERVLFVNDGSTDETLQILTEAATRHSGFQVLDLERNQGKAEAVRRGLIKAIDEKAEIVGYLDADLATPPEEMRRILEVVDRGADVALGSRVSLLGRHIEREPARHYLGRIFATAASLALGLRVYDTQCGAKVFRVTDSFRRAIEKPFSSRWAFDVELLSRLLGPGSDLDASKIVEVPLLEWRDVKGSKLSSRAMFKSGLDLLSIARNRRRR